MWRGQQTKNIVIYRIHFVWLMINGFLCGPGNFSGRTATDAWTASNFELVVCELCTAVANRIAAAQRASKLRERASRPVTRCSAITIAPPSCTPQVVIPRPLHLSICLYSMKNTQRETDTHTDREIDRRTDTQTERQRERAMVRLAHSMRGLADLSAFPLALYHGDAKPCARRCCATVSFTVCPIHKVRRTEFNARCRTQHGDGLIFDFSSAERRGSPPPEPSRRTVRPAKRPSPPPP